MSNEYISTHSGAQIDSAVDLVLNSSPGVGGDKVLTSNAAGGAEWKNPAWNNPMTAREDIIVGGAIVDGKATPTAVPTGNKGTVLTVGPAVSNIGWTAPLELSSVCLKLNFTLNLNTANTFFYIRTVSGTVLAQTGTHTYYNVLGIDYINYNNGNTDERTLLITVDNYDCKLLAYCNNEVALLPAPTTSLNFDNLFSVAHSAPKMCRFIFSEYYDHINPGYNLTFDYVVGSQSQTTGDQDEPPEINDPLPEVSS